MAVGQAATSLSAGSSSKLNSPAVALVSGLSLQRRGGGGHPVTDSICAVTFRNRGSGDSLDDRAMISQ